MLVQVLARTSVNILHQGLGRHVLHYFSIIDVPLAFRKAKRDAFALGVTFLRDFTSAAEVRLGELDLASQLTDHQLSHVIQHIVQTLVCASDYLRIHAQIYRQAVHRLLEIEFLQGDGPELEPCRGFFLLRPRHSHSCILCE